MKVRFHVEEIHKISLKPDEVLIVKVTDPDTTSDQLRRIKEYLCNVLETKKILVYGHGNLEFPKVGLEEHLIDELIEKELLKK